MELQAAGRPFEVHIEPCIPEVDADPDRIAQVMDNLLTNAVKYGAQGSAIAVRVSCEGGALAVAVTSHGRPLTAEELTHMFERFQRADSAKRTGIPGVGLGLYISRSLVEAHGGCIEAQSTPEGATTVRFTLPVAGS
jgi:signal transduction histidine kinase